MQRQRLLAGRIACGYHDLVMGGDGKCVSMPGQRVKPTRLVAEERNDLPGN